MENYQSSGQTTPTVMISDKSKVVAALLAFFLGIFGAHRIYLGKSGSGFTFLILSIVSIFLSGFIIGFFILGILSIIAVVDFFRILFGSFRDGTGAMLQ